VYSYDRNERYIKLPTYTYDKLELVDKYCEVYKNQNRVPNNIQDFINLQPFGMKYRINRLRSVPENNCIKGIDGILHPFLDDILTQSYDLYKLSCRFIKSLDFAELVELVKSKFVENPIDDDEEEDDEEMETNSINSSETSEERRMYHKSLEEIIKMLERHTPIEYKSTTTAVETVERKLEKLKPKQPTDNGVLRSSKKDKKSNKTDELEMLRRRILMLEGQLGGEGV
jgi:hypothetical protein